MIRTKPALGYISTPLVAVQQPVSPLVVPRTVEVVAPVVEVEPVPVVEPMSVVVEPVPVVVEPVTVVEPEVVVEPVPVVELRLVVEPPVVEVGSVVVGSGSDCMSRSGLKADATGSSRQCFSMA